LYRWIGKDRVPHPVYASHQYTMDVAKIAFQGIPSMLNTIKLYLLSQYEYIFNGLGTKSLLLL
jgi:hypothetical protein